MNHEPTMNTPDTTGHDAGRATVPMWLIVLTFLLLFGGAVYFDATGGWFDSNVYAPYHSVADLQRYQLPHGDRPDLVLGQRMFKMACELCHNPDGKGKPGQAPPLAGSDWVQGPPERVTRIPLAGLGGPIDVAGVHYEFAAAMPGVGAGLSDDDLAATLSYIRQAWGNKAEPITSEQVKAIRAKIGNRTVPWTPAELQQFK